MTLFIFIERHILSVFSSAVPSVPLPLLIRPATEATVPVEKPLIVGAIYYWRVRGGNDAGWGPWSPVSSFRVLEETA